MIERIMKSVQVFGTFIIAVIVQNARYIMGEYTGTNDEFILKDGPRRFFNANGIDKMFILPIKLSFGLPVANFLHIRGHFIGKEVFQNEIHTL